MAIKNLAWGAHEFVVTVNVVIDELAGLKILHTPENMQHKMGWATVPKGGPVELPDGISAGQMLFLLHSGNFLACMRRERQSYGLLILRPDEPFDASLGDIEDQVARRLIVVRETKDSAHFTMLLTSLQALFFAAYRWTDMCSRIVSTGGSMQDLIDASADVFDNWIDVNDANYSLLAYSHGMEPPDDLSRNLIQMGCHSAEIVAQARDIGCFKEWSDQNDIEVFDKDELVGYPYLTKVLRIDDVYSGHVVMVCNKHALTEGVKDLFRAFSRYCLAIAERNNGHDKQTLSRYQDFIYKLLEGTAFSEGYVTNQLKIIGIDDADTFTLAILDRRNGMYADQPVFLLSTVREMFQDTLSVPYEDMILLLNYSRGFDGERVAEHTSRIKSFCEQFDCAAYLSNTFGSVEDLHFAYEQACLAHKYRSAINTANPCEQRRRTFKFFEAFNYYCTDFANRHDAFLSFCLDTTPVETVVRMEPERDVPDAKLLYCYLRNERKATLTAKELHMHRNNVLYRVKNISERYQLDLDNFELRQALLSSFRMKINSSSEFRKLIA